MPYQVIEDGTYDGTTLKVWRVYDWEDYQNTAIKHPRPLGEIWQTGVRGVTGIWLPTGIRWQISGTDMLDSHALDMDNGYKAGAQYEAARVMIQEFDRMYPPR